MVPEGGGSEIILTLQVRKYAKTVRQEVFIVNKPVGVRGIKIHRLDSA